MPIRDREFSVDARGPLSGVCILDLSRVVAGNMVSLALADFGAEVINRGPQRTRGSSEEGP